MGCKMGAETEPNPTNNLLFNPRHYDVELYILTGGFSGNVYRVLVNWTHPNPVRAGEIKVPCLE